jgi:hypothetical protein
MHLAFLWRHLDTVVTASDSPPTQWNEIRGAADEAVLNKVPKKDNLLNNEEGSQYMSAKIIC